MKQQIIVNGGNPLDGCPKDWDEAKEIEQNLNEGKDDEDSQPKWSFDCGFKLDFDGPLIEVSSRFYPPKQHYGPNWDGYLRVYMVGERILEQEFCCKTLPELHLQVEKYIQSIKEKIREVKF